MTDQLFNSRPKKASGFGNVGEEEKIFCYVLHVCISTVSGSRKMLERTIGGGHELPLILAWSSMDHMTCTSS